MRLSNLSLNHIHIEIYHFARGCPCLVFSSSLLPSQPFIGPEPSPNNRLNQQGKMHKRAKGNWPYCWWLGNNFIAVSDRSRLLKSNKESSGN